MTGYQASLTYYLIGAILVTGYVVLILRTGRVSGAGIYDRTKSPRPYWMLVTIFALLAAVMWFEAIGLF